MLERTDSFPIVPTVRPPVESAMDRPHLLVVGSASARAEANLHLRRLGLPEIHRQWTSDVAASLDRRCTGVMLVGRPPTRKSSRDLRAAVAALATKAHYEGRRVPVIVLAHRGMTDPCAWRLYRAGATAVISLDVPTGDEYLPDHLTVLLEATLLEATTGSGRGSTTGQIEAHLGLRLRLASPRLEGLELDVSDQVVRVRGSVKHTDDRRRVREVLANAPGIGELCLDGLRVESAEGSEDLVARVDARVDGLLGPHNTLHWHVSEGRVVLAGTLPRADLLQRLLAVVWTTPGVKAVDNDVVVSERQARESVCMAQAIRRRWRAEGLGDGLRIGVIGPFVVVRGVPSDSRWRRMALSVALEIPGVKSVIDAGAGRGTH